MSSVIKKGGEQPLTAAMCHAATGATSGAAVLPDNRPQAALQKKQIAGMNNGQPIQRKIMLKNKTVLDVKTVTEADKAPVKTMKEAGGTYLMENAGDVDKVNNDNDGDVNILSPNRHVIGETHGESMFVHAANDWAWGAAKMIEALSENAMMPHIAGDTARRDVNALEHNAMPLEDTMVKNLAVCMIIKDPLNGLLEFAQKGIDKHGDDDEKESMGDKKESGVTFLLKTARADSKSILSIIADLQGYYEASPGGLARLFTSAKKRPVVDQIEKFLSTNPYERLDPLYSMLDQQYQTGKNQFTESVLVKSIKCIDELIFIYRELVRLNQNDLYNRHDVGAATGLHDMGGAREEHMAAKIGNLPVPGLVKIGREHITGLGPYHIPHVLFYNHYFDFAMASSAEEVKKRL